MSRRYLKSLATILAITTSVNARASMQVTSWFLGSDVRLETSTGVTHNTHTNQVVQNPFEATIVSQIGLNRTSDTHAFSWQPGDATGSFHTDLIHTIRSPRVETFSSSTIYVLPNEDIRVAYSGLLNYAHTPGDEYSLEFDLSIQNVLTNQFSAFEIRRGGNFYLEPSSGVLSFGNEALLSAGTTYRITYDLNINNSADFSTPPTGILDASGFVDIQIRPAIPEPATSLFFLIPLLTSARRTRRNATCP